MARTHRKNDKERPAKPGREKNQQQATADRTRQPVLQQRKDNIRQLADLRQAQRSGDKAAENKKQKKKSRRLEDMQRSVARNKERRNEDAVDAEPQNEVRVSANDTENNPSTASNPSPAYNAAGDSDPSRNATGRITEKPKVVLGPNAVAPFSIGEAQASQNTQWSLTPSIDQYDTPGNQIGVPRNWGTSNPQLDEARPASTVRLRGPLEVFQEFHQQLGNSHDGVTHHPTPLSIPQDHDALPTLPAPYYPPPPSAVDYSTYFYPPVGSLMHPGLDRPLRPCSAPSNGVASPSGLPLSNSRSSFCVASPAPSSSAGVTSSAGYPMESPFSSTHPSNAAHVSVHSATSGSSSNHALSPSSDNNEYRAASTSSSHTHTPYPTAPSSATTNHYDVTSYNTDPYPSYTGYSNPSNSANYETLDQFHGGSNSISMAHVSGFIDYLYDLGLPYAYDGNSSLGNSNADASPVQAPDSASPHASFNSTYIFPHSGRPNTTASSLEYHPGANPGTVDSPPLPYPSDDPCNRLSSHSCPTLCKPFYYSIPGRQPEQANSWSDASEAAASSNPGPIVQEPGYFGLQYNIPPSEMQPSVPSIGVGKPYPDFYPLQTFNAPYPPQAEQAATLSTEHDEESEYEESVASSVPSWQQQTGYQYASPDAESSTPSTDYGEVLYFDSHLLTQPAGYQIATLPERSNTLSAEDDGPDSAVEETQIANDASESEDEDAEGESEHSESEDEDAEGESEHSESEDLDAEGESEQYSESVDVDSGSGGQSGYEASTSSSPSPPFQEGYQSLQPEQSNLLVTQSNASLAQQHVAYRSTPLLEPENLLPSSRPSLPIHHPECISPRPRRPISLGHILNDSRCSNVSYASQIEEQWVKYLTSSSVGISVGPARNPVVTRRSTGMPVIQETTARGAHYNDVSQVGTSLSRSTAYPIASSSRGAQSSHVIPAQHFPTIMTANASDKGKGKQVAYNRDHT